MKYLLLALLPLTAYADFPANDLYKEDGHFFTSMTEAKFNEIIDSVEKVYKPIFAGFGAKLNVERNWSDPTVNAYASQSGSTWNVAMFGGLARRPEITDDGFALVLCHEIGHHLGGFPRYYGNTNWAAVEGQADYFSTHVCAKKLMSQSRALAGGQSLANLLAKLQGAPMPSPETPDESVVSQTYEGHPDAQCRLDTYIAGSKCKLVWNDKLIPKVDGYTCDNRSRCWFAP